MGRASRLSTSVAIAVALGALMYELPARAQIVRAEVHVEGMT